jgi:hypothetical protein
MLDPQPRESGGTMVEPSPGHDVVDGEEARLVAFVDALAELAADLWFAGKLDSKSD